MLCLFHHHSNETKMSNLSAKLLEFKENPRQLSGNLNDDFLSQSISAQSRTLDKLFEQLETCILSNDADSSCSSSSAQQQLMELVGAMDQLSGQVRIQLLDLTLGSAKLLTNYAREKLSTERCNSDCDGIRMTAEMIFFALYKVAYFGERIALSAVVAEKKSTKKTASKTKHVQVWAWPKYAEMIVACMGEFLKLDLQKVWTLMDERAPFLGMFYDTANAMLENDRHAKNGPLRFQLHDLLVTGICYLNHGPAFQISVM